MNEFREGSITSLLGDVQSKTCYEDGSGAFKWPCMVSDSLDNAYVTWEISSRPDNYGNSDYIFLRKFSANGTFLEPTVLLVNRSDLSNATIALSHSTLKIDSHDNFHLFWYVMEFDSPQIGHVYYKKFAHNFDVLVESKIIITYQQPGWGMSAYNDMISKVIVDNHNFLHLLCCEKYYIYLDNNGTFLDTFPLKVTGTVHDPSMTVDSLDKVFIVWEEDYRTILFRGLRVDNSSIISVVNNTLDSRENVLNPIILMGNEGLFASWQYVPDFDYGSSETIYRQLNDLGETLSTEKCGFNNPGIDIISWNKSLIYTIQPVGYSCFREDLTIYYSLRSFKGDIIIRKRPILQIPWNPDFDHGPDLYSLNGIDNGTGYLWLAWYMNDFTNGPLLLLWKLDSNASSVFPITVVKPTHLIGEYEGALYNFTTPILTTAATIMTEATYCSTVPETTQSLPTVAATTMTEATYNSTVPETTRSLTTPRITNTSKTPLMSETLLTSASSSLFSTQAWHILVLFSSILFLIIYRRIKRCY